MPVNQMSGIHIQAPQMVTILSFQTVKDYDDYISRLQQLPRVFDETMANMRKGMADGLMPPKFLLEKVVDQTNANCHAPPDKIAVRPALRQVSGQLLRGRQDAPEDSGPGGDQGRRPARVREVREVREGRIRSQRPDRGRRLVAAQWRCDLSPSW